MAYFPGPPPIMARISVSRQQVVRGPNFTGFGKRPDLTPAHQELFEIGMSGGWFFLGSPTICQRRSNPL